MAGESAAVPRSDRVSRHPPVDLLLRQRDPDRALEVAKDVASREPKNFRLCGPRSRGIAAGDTRREADACSHGTLGQLRSGQECGNRDAPVRSRRPRGAIYSLDKILRGNADHLPALTLSTEAASAAAITEGRTACPSDCRTLSDARHRPRLSGRYRGRPQVSSRAAITIIARPWQGKEHGCCTALFTVPKRWRATWPRGWSSSTNGRATTRTISRPSRTRRRPPAHRRPAAARCRL